MKKILFAALVFICLKSQSQLTGTVNLTLKAGDWSFISGHVTQFSMYDSTTIVYLNRLRDTLLVANPATFNTNVRFNSIPAQLVYDIYVKVKHLPASLYDQVGNNISNQIKAIANTALQ